MRNLIEAEWQGLLEKIRAPDMGPQQIRDMQKAFFAGALTLRNILLENVSEDPDVTPNDEMLMEDISRELETFARGVIQEANDLPDSATSAGKGQ